MEIVRQAFEAYGRRDLDSVLQYLDPEFELHSAIVGRAEGNVYRGHKEVREWLADSDGSFEDLRFGATESHDLGDQVLILGASGRGDGRVAWSLIPRAAGCPACEGGKLVKSGGLPELG